VRAAACVAHGPAPIDTLAELYLGWGDAEAPRLGRVPKMPALPYTTVLSLTMPPVDSAAVSFCAASGAEAGTLSTVPAGPFPSARWQIARWTTTD